MNRAEKYIAIATAEKVRSRGLIKSVATEAARLQREETRRNAIEVYKQMCPSKVSKGCGAGRIRMKRNRRDAMGVVRGLSFL